MPTTTTITRHWRSSRALLCSSALFTAVCCLPRSDLDVYGSGKAGAGGAGVAGATASSGNGGSQDVGGGTGGGDAGAPEAAGNAGSTAQAGTAGASGTSGAGGTSGSAGTGGDGCAAAPTLQDTPVELPPSDLPGYVTGSVTCDPKATWEVGPGVYEPTLRIETTRPAKTEVPTTVYYLHAASGAIVSISKDDIKVPQWVKYSNPYRPERGLPFLATGECCAPPGSTSARKMVTTCDAPNTVAKHQRINSRSEDGAWALTWDFYPTHGTLTIEKSPASYGFKVQVKPMRGDVNSDVQFWMSGGDGPVAADTTGSQDLPSPEWARLSEKGATGESLFFIQHRDDCLPDAYASPPHDQAGNTYELDFGSGNIAAGTRSRYSFGLTASDRSLAEARIAYVVDAMK